MAGEEPLIGAKRGCHLRGWIERAAAATWPAEIRLVETKVNGQPALAAYLPDVTGTCLGTASSC
ncbi:hypothetical protein [Actinomadura macra]|uniref:hypothetical protein n=1 Tax=Actinomadura macra TaxID=46164 RepID=UPI0014724900|nr:hypothetical protein [Actinomadura macra]